MNVSTNSKKRLRDNTAPFIARDFATVKQG